MLACRIFPISRWAGREFTTRRPGSRPSCGGRAARRRRRSARFLRACRRGGGGHQHESRLQPVRVEGGASRRRWSRGTPTFLPRNGYLPDRSRRGPVRAGCPSTRSLVLEASGGGLYRDRLPRRSDFRWRCTSRAGHGSSISRLLGRIRVADEASSAGLCGRSGARVTASVLRGHRGGLRNTILLHPPSFFFSFLSFLFFFFILFYFYCRRVPGGPSPRRRICPCRGGDRGALPGDGPRHRGPARARLAQHAVRDAAWRPSGRRLGDGVADVLRVPAVLRRLHGQCRGRRRALRRRRRANAYATPVRFGSRAEMVAGFLRAMAPPGGTPLVRARQLAHGLPRVALVFKEHLAAFCEVAEMLTDRLGSSRGRSGSVRSRRRALGRQGPARSCEAG